MLFYLGDFGEGESGKDDNIRVMNGLPTEQSYQGNHSFTIQGLFCHTVDGEQYSLLLALDLKPYNKARKDRASE